MVPKGELRCKSSAPHSEHEWQQPQLDIHQDRWPTYWCPGLLDIPFVAESKKADETPKDGPWTLRGRLKRFIEDEGNHIIAEGTLPGAHTGDALLRIEDIKRILEEDE